ncbi:hypothetical protein HELRODRAFT_185351 [Helobdella robusta]|uniref:Protein sleepless n=1 Tax=Helobdella robusta TaxID=6412 RepID=T1FMP9_HELRO|nr:hypothetical protein HELRODRAFT_185351 [Helobdella robusta]ESO09503.1 hypothetical protein HELRODRAFT_185351 [Helobdella robusta]
MMKASSVFLIIIPILACLVAFFASGSHGIQCFVCMSGDKYNGEKCENLKPTDRDFIVNCSTLPPRNNYPWERCRVMVHDVEGETRTVRSCATWPDKSRENRCVDRTGTARIKVRLCECDTDFCNHMSMAKASIFLIVSTLVISLIKF